MTREQTSAADAWCILRTAGPRTLKLAESLGQIGVDAWTPKFTVKRRAMRGKKATENHDAPLTPTFVFARADALDRLRAIIGEPRSPHPAFSLFRYNGRIPLLADREIERLRLAEHRGMPRAQRLTYQPGTIVRPTEGPYVGMNGVVRRSDGKFTLVAFGGWMDVQIETFAIRSNDVHGSSSPGPEAKVSGIAASAARVRRSGVS